MNTIEVLKTDKKLHDFLQDHLLRGRVEKLMEEYHKQQLSLCSVVYSKNGMNTPNPENTHYTIWKFKDNDQEFQIDGRNLVYCQLGSTHHGCQCMHTGEKEEHKLITSKLKQVCDLLKEVDKLNNP